MNFHARSAVVALLIGIGFLPLRAQPAPGAASAAPPIKAEAAGPGVAAQVRALTGAHTRIVWCEEPDRRDVSRGAYDLDGLDTDDDRGIRTILTPLPSCNQPLITPSGRAILFSNRVDNWVYRVNWDGTGLSRLVQGFASDVWQDPRTGIEWVYVRGGDGLKNNAIRRYQIDKPSVSELVWDQTPTDQDAVPWFAVSADGTRAAAAFPWPKCGIALLPNRSWVLVGHGCWTSMAPDDSYRSFHFDGTHKEIVLSDADGANPRTILLSSAPGVGGNQVLYPRWTNNVRFLTMAGPGDDAAAEAYLGRFNASFTAVEAWVRLTNNRVPDRWTCAWIDPGSHPAVATPGGGPPPAG